MILSEPIRFHPLLMERVWGGRELERLFNKPLPPGVRIGESWELVDRPEAQSVVNGGALDGVTLHELWSEHRAGIFGERHDADGERFPLLFKLLDAQEALSVQVHPPAEVAPLLSGEPKTEMWYLAAATPEAELFAGLAEGVSREDFENALREGGLARLLHRLPGTTGECLFIPSGRVHAIGAGNVIVEVQQNSDTTYRVYDWDRPGLDGQPRALHVDASLASIDFNDHTPDYQPHREGEPLVSTPYFEVERWDLNEAKEAIPFGDFTVITVLQGALRCAGQEFVAGDFFLVPAKLTERTLHPLRPGTRLLRTRLPF